MSVEQDSRTGPGLKVNPPQNNPFRRANSPMNSPPLSGVSLENRKSNNPFLDPDLVATSPPKASGSPKKTSVEVDVRNLSLDDPKPSDPPAGPGAGPGHAASRLLQMKPGQMPPGRGPPPPPGANPRGQYREKRPGERGPDGEKRIRSPSEERRRRERHEWRKKEKEAGLKDSQGRPVPSQSSGRSKKARAPHLDAIDKLDSTGSFLDPFGTGYHVSGPYDATFSKQTRKLRPIDAFAKDSLNMVMGGGRMNFDKHVHADARNMYGHVDDAANDYNNAVQPTTSNDPSNRTRADSKRKNDLSFDPLSKIEQVHGDSTAGLGTSTFLEGAPAPASAIRRESESQERDATAGGISRTRSIAQRFRSQRNRDRSNSSGLVSPERRTAPPPPGAHRTITSLGEPGKATSAGGLDQINETRNPFFEDYDEAYDIKGAAIKNAEVGVTLEDKGPKPSHAPLTRSITEDNSSSHRRNTSTASSGGEGKEKKDGFLGRMKSLRGRKKEKAAE